MTKILIDRAVLEQALTTLEGWGNYDKWVWPESALFTAKKNTAEMITALRAALEQPKSLPSPIWRLVPTTMTNDMARVDQELRHAVPWIRWEAILAAAPNPQGD